MPDKLLPTITHVIFDLDGLLLDTERLYTIATNNIANRFGKLFTFDDKQAVMGRSEQQSAAIVIERLQLPITVDEYLDAMKHEQHRLFPGAELMPGALQLVEHLRRNDVPLAVATGSTQREFQLKTASHSHLLNHFQHWVLSCDAEVAHGKPAPDIFHVCRRRFAHSPNAAQTLVFEDAMNGVLAAVAAGMQVVAVPDARANREEFLKHTDHVLSSLHDFDAAIFGLPRFNNV